MDVPFAADLYCTRPVLNGNVAVLDQMEIGGSRLPHGRGHRAGAYMAPFH